MKRLVTALAIIFMLPTMASAGQDSHPFNANDLVMMDRVGDPVLSPNGKQATFSLRETDYEGNKGVNSVWVVATQGGKPLRLTDKTVNASSPRWSPDGKSIYFMAAKDGVNQLWKAGAKGGVAEAVSQLPLDINNFMLAPDGKRILLSLDVFSDCADLACTKKRLDEQAANKTSGHVYNKLFIRHWDTWADGRRSQLFIAAISADGKISAEPVLLSKGIDGDVPSKPFGDDSEYAFSPDGNTVYFNARIAGTTEAWSTNFDIYSVPTDATAKPKNLTADNQAWDAYPLPSHDGKTLYYLAMKRPTFEADRFGIMALDLASGKTREIAPNWDSSASALKLSGDGKTLYTASDDWGDHALFTINIANGKTRKIISNGAIAAFDVVGNQLVFSKHDLKRPANLYSANAHGQEVKMLTQFNADRLKNIRFGDYEFYTFKGWNNETVQGYVVKPVDYQRGKKYPVAFIIHGGPQGAMTNQFHYRWNAQTYAGQGYAVVTVNFHGSTGYGQAFTDSISGDWGGKPLEDLKRGWEAALNKYPWLDSSRACALGASYGGYMVNWIAGNWNEPWKCLVNHDGVFDNRMMGYSTEELWFDEWENKGTPYEKPENYEKHNPVNHVNDWRVPMLVIHGEKDFRIPVEQGIGAFTALQRQEIPSQFLVFPDENHWVVKPQNSVLWHETVNAWLKQWMQ